MDGAWDLGKAAPPPRCWGGGGEIYLRRERAELSAASVSPASEMSHWIEQLGRGGAGHAGN